MRLYIYFTVILFLLFGCGAQNTPQNTPVGEAQDEENTGVANSNFSNNNSTILAQNIFINFPNSLEKTDNSTFNKEVKSLKKELFRVENIFFFIEEIFIDIQTICKEKKFCTLKNETLNRFNNLEDNLSFTEISYSFEPSKSTYQYQLKLHTNNNEKITFSWDINSSSIKTDYQKENSHVNILYLNDLHKEACYIYNNKKEYHSFYLSTNDEKNYQLRSHHVYKSNNNFSTNIKLQYYEETLTLKHIFKINNDIKSKNEGVYFLFPPKVDIEKLSLTELPFQLEGSLLKYKNNTQGGLYSDKFIENIDKLKVLYLDKNNTLVKVPKVSNSFTLY